MKIILSFLTLFIFTSYAQNLVNNPSFENYSSCPTGGVSTLPLAISWSDPYVNIIGDTCSTSDYYHSCSAFGGVPSNILGNEPAHTGNGYAGIIIYEGLPDFGNPCNSLLSTSWREYVQNQLTTPLVAGEEYCISFWVSLADDVKWASNNFGVYLSSTQLAINCSTVGAATDLSSQGYTPQLIYSGAPITNSNGWTKLQFSYIATGGEQYVVIGNFFGDASTNYTCVNSGAFNPYSYYYIDDVSVINEVCCDPSFNDPSPLCVSDAPVTLTPFTSGGTWSGTGVNASGQFDPAIAGTGNHTITYTLPCGFEDVVITVSACNLQVCIETNGDFTVSNGVGPYSWQETIAPSSTPITNQTQCTACGYTWAGFVCLNGVTPVTTCASPGGLQTFTTGTTITPTANFPIQVTDNTGTTYLINSAGSLTACTTNPCPTLTVNITSQTNVNCFGQSTGAATVSTGNGTAPYTYTWVPGSLNGATQTGLAAGNYTVNIIDNASCPGTINVNITQPTAALSATVNTTPTGCGTSTGTATAVVSGGTTNYTFVWSNSASTTATATGLAAGPGTVTITDALGCQIVRNFSITTPGAPTLVVSNIVGVNCATSTNGSATVSASGGTAPLTYSWTPSGENTPTATGLSAGNNTITVTDVAGCSASEIVNIPAPAPIVLSETITPTNCGEAIGEISISATGGTGTLTYTWTPNVGSGAIISNLIGGTYDLTVEDDNGCTISDSYIADVIGSLPVIASPTSIQVDAGDTVQLFASGATNYTWSPATGLSCTNCPNPVASPTETTVYTVTGTDDFGCTGQATVMILIQTVCGDIFIPTIFSPNEDGNNDIQCVMGNCIATMKYSIYDRWGEKVFETETQSECWDGMYKGRKMNPGVFAYKFNALLIDGTIIEQSGNLTLVR